MAVNINGKVYQWVLRDQAGNVTQTGPEVGTAGATGSAPANIAAPDNSALRGQLTGLIATTTAAYNQLMTAGRDNDAFALRDALERFTRTGAQLGVNPWARTQAINDLRARMTATAQQFQGTTTAQALAAQAGLLDKIGSLDATSFNQAVQAHQANLSGAQFAETQRKNTWDMNNYWNQQEQQAAAARQVMPTSQTATPITKTPTASTIAKAGATPPVAAPYQFAWQKTLGAGGAATPYPDDSSKVVGSSAWYNKYW